MSLSTVPKSASTELKIGTKKHYLKSIFYAVPNIIVFLMLAGTIYVGHHTGWKLPKFSELTGNSIAAISDWCTDHLVPESQCIECKSDLLPKDKEFGFCKEHGVAECVTHHPELAQVNGEPKLPKYDTVQAVQAITRTENSNRDTLHTKRVQFTTAESVLKSGIEVDLVGEGTVTETITTNGELIFDPNRVALLSSKIPGTVAAVLKNIGDRVSTGDLLALVDASQVGSLKSELLKNIVQIRLQKDNVERLSPLTLTGAISKRELLEAETALQEAEVALLSTRQFLSNLGFEVPEITDADTPKELAEKLQYLGIPQSIVTTLPPQARSGNLIPIFAPFDGVVLTSDVVLGTVVDASRSLFTVCDPSKIWIMLNVRQEDARYVREGQQVQFLSDNGDQKVDGVISWISPAIDLRTRTLKVRAEVENPDRQLRDKTFGTGKIVLREEPNAVLVPQEAVQSTAESQYVFVRDKNYFDDNAPKMFHVRQVRLGAKNGRNVEILAGVLPDEVVVTKGSNVLLAHLLRSNLGAGCCAEH
ncbi:MAG: efflux RND transporter periplasmic adaptor subunit [Planctomycetaceae bacterium]|jgi:cobalt-zinc-cadmium efflux system membrane fusion protein|nr:efflux RND transporter periplasmic adaptor subunit [Planctomycetaceae bacterium]